MRIAFTIVLQAHALIHLMGFLKAFGLARLDQLTTPVSRSWGVVWLAASLLLLAASVALVAAPAWFWLLAALGVVASQAAITSAWRDAKVGTVVNAVTLLVMVYGAAAWGPFGLRAEYEQRVERSPRATAVAPPITDADLAPLPPPVQRYLRYVGVVGQPRVGAFHVRFAGRIRSGPAAAWMPFTGEQRSVLAPPTRLFSMHATMHGVPVEALHVYDGDGARMRVKLLSLFPLVDASGQEFTRTETVTLLNDMCIMAPATLVDPSIRWRPLDERSVEATYTRDQDVVHAVLVFGDDGALVDFWSDDRPSLAPDGVTLVPQRWSTPVRDYRLRRGVRLASRGEGRYAAPEGEYAYIELDDLDVSYEP